MSMQSFAELGVSEVVSDVLAERGITEPFAVQQRVMPDVLAGHDVLVKSPTGSGKTLAFGVPMMERLEAAETRGRRRSCSPPPVSSRSRSSPSCATPPTRARSRRGRLRRRGHRAPGQARRRRAHILVATPGRLEDLVERRVLSSSQRADARARRGRPHARHGLPARGRADRASDPGQPPDALLLRDARRRGRPDRARPTPPTPGATRSRRSRSAGAIDIEPPLRGGHHARPSSTSWSGCSRPSRAWSSSSCAPSAAPTGSRSASDPRHRRPRPCTANKSQGAARARARRVRARCACARSWQPTWRRAGSTSRP